MAPKKRPGKMVETVVTSKKVVEETVKVVVTPTEKEVGKVEVVSSSTKEIESVEVFTSPAEKEKEKEKEPVTRSVPLQDEEEPTPNQPAEEGDEDETQPASEPETIPQPPKLETSQKKEEENKENEKKRKSTAVKEQGKKKKKKKRGRAGGEGGEGYKRYIFRVMKQVHPDMGFSSMAMTVINNLMSDMFERIANEAAGLLKFSGRTTLSSREIQGAVKLVLPGELGKHAIAEGTKAVTNYISSSSKH